jgi:hypothetical protein
MRGPSGPSLRFGVLVFAAALAAAAAGCKQGSGDRCEINSDCDDGLLCDTAAGDNSGGICRSIAGPVDSGAGKTDTAAEAASDAASEAAADAPAETGGSEAGEDAGADAPADADAAPVSDGSPEEAGG